MITFGKLYKVINNHLFSHLVFVNLHGFIKFTQQNLS